MAINPGNENNVDKYGRSFDHNFKPLPNKDIEEIIRERFKFYFACSIFETSEREQSIDSSGNNASSNPDSNSDTSATGSNVIFGDGTVKDYEKVLIPISNALELPVRDEREEKDGKDGEKAEEKDGKPENELGDK